MNHRSNNLNIEHSTLNIQLRIGEKHTTEDGRQYGIQLVFTALACLGDLYLNLILDKNISKNLNNEVK